MAHVSVGLGSSPELFAQPSASRESADSSGFLIREPLISKIGDAADIAYEWHHKTGGSTVSVVDGSLVGKRLYALSIFPGRTVELLEPPTSRQLFVFALENSEFLLRKNCALGTWCHQRRRVHVLDVVVCVSNLLAALELAKSFDQESIYSLERRQEIAVPYHQVISVESFVEGGNEQPAAH